MRQLHAVLQLMYDKLPGKKQRNKLRREIVHISIDRTFHGISRPANMELFTCWFSALAMQNLQLASRLTEQTLRGARCFRRL